MWQAVVQAQVNRSLMTYESRITAVVWRPLDSVVRFSSHGVLVWNFGETDCS
jgi:hypothetical protein